MLRGYHVSVGQYPAQDLSSKVLKWLPLSRRSADDKRGLACDGQLNELLQKRMRAPSKSARIARGKNQQNGRKQ